MAFAIKPYANTSFGPATGDTAVRAPGTMTPVKERETEINAVNASVESEISFSPGRIAPRAVDRNNANEISPLLSFRKRR